MSYLSGSPSGQHPFDWYAVRKVTFIKQSHSAFFSMHGGGTNTVIHTTFPSREKWDEIIRTAMVHLDRDQVFYI